MNKPELPEHSELPWKYHGWPISNTSQPRDDWHCGNIHCGRDVIAVAYGDTMEQMDANAAYIARACNAYPHAQRLTEALREFVRVMEHPKTTVAMPHTVAKARKALAQWKETQR